MSADLERYTAIADWVNEGNLAKLGCVSVLTDEIILETQDRTQNESRLEVSSDTLPERIRAKITKLTITLLNIEQQPYGLSLGSETVSGIDYLARIRVEAHVRFSTREPQTVELMMEPGDTMPLCVFEVFQGLEIGDVPIFRVDNVQAEAVSLVPIFEE